MKQGAPGFGYGQSWKASGLGFYLSICQLSFCSILVLFSERLTLYYPKIAASITLDYLSNTFKSRTRATDFVQYPQP